MQFRRMAIIGILSISTPLNIALDVNLSLPAPLIENRISTHAKGRGREIAESLDVSEALEISEESEVLEGIDNLEDVYYSSIELAAYYLDRIEKGDHAFHGRFVKEIKGAVEEDPVTAAFLLMEYSKLLNGKRREHYHDIAEKLFRQSMGVDRRNKYRNNVTDD